MAAACAAGPPVEAIDWILLALLLVAFPATIAWMGYLHAGLIRTGRLVSVIPAWVAALSWIVPVLNLVLPYHLLLRYARAMSMHRGLVALIGVLWVIDVVFYAAMAVPAIAGDLPVPWRIRAEFLDSLLGPVGLILTGVLVIRFSRRAAQI